MEDNDTPRPIEASLAHALAWGAPTWILDRTQHQPTGDAGPRRSVLRSFRNWIRRNGR